MIRFPLALAGLALLCIVPAQAAVRPKAPVPSPNRTQADQAGAVMPQSVSRVHDWALATGDNRSLPFIIVDKQAAHAFLFDAQGKQVLDTPVLIGRTLGDEATPGIGAKSLAEIGPAEKTTPAGRFLARFGWAGSKRGGREQVLWVDYADSVALHMIPPDNKEHRTRRMLSPTIADNRITFGCINVTKAFYNGGVRPLFGKKGGYVYVLPDVKPLEEVFPLLRLQRPSQAGGQ